MKKELSEREKKTYKEKKTNEKGKGLPPKAPWNCSSKQDST